MTETEWLMATNPSQMIEYLGSKATDRKFRLFICACCRHSVWHLLSVESQALVDAAEQFADSQLDSRGLGAAKGKATKAMNKGIDNPFYNVYVHEVTRKPASNGAWRFTWVINNNNPCVEQCDLARCIFGNPFCSVAGNPTWFTSDVRALAEGIYQDRAFDRLPILADALQDAGCDNADILSHSREPGEHVRGCWVVDLVLGKE